MKEEIQDRVDGYAKHIQVVAEQEYLGRLDMVIEAGVTSPIEQLYAATLLYMQSTGEASRSIKIIPQFKVGKYRADFYITDSIPQETGYDQVFAILVELDSYQFHNRNPKQHTYEKKREREIQKAGYFIIRFSGSEVIKDPERCVVETLQTLYKNCGVAVF